MNKIMSAPMLASTVTNLCQRGVNMPWPLFNNALDDGVPIDFLDDVEQENVASRAYQFEPGAECLKFGCGCAVAFIRPYQYPARDIGAYYLVAPKCRTTISDRAQVSGSRWIDLYTMMVGTNAIKYARAEKRPAHRSAVLALSGQPHDPEAIIDYVTTHVVNPRSGDTGDAAIMLIPMLNDPELYGEIPLSAVRALYPTLFPFLSLSYLTNASAHKVLADYKNHVEIRG